LFTACTYSNIDRFQVVLPANDSIFDPGIYNCGKNKSLVEHLVPIIQAGSLFHIHTCAKAEIKRHDQAENEWILWHRRFRYMPFDTIQQMVNICQGLDDFKGILILTVFVSQRNGSREHHLLARQRTKGHSHISQGR
jgi:hypothetical protein